MGGVPCVRDTRIPATRIVKMVAAGMTPEVPVEELPKLAPDELNAALRCAAAAVAERALPIRPTA